MTHIASSLSKILTTLRVRRAALTAIAVVGLLFAGYLASEGVDRLGGGRSAAQTLTEPLTQDAAAAAPNAFVAEAEPEASASGSGAAKSSAPQAGGPKSATSPMLPGEPMLAKTATLSLEVEDLAMTASRVRAVTSSQRGVVLTESLGSGGEVGSRARRPREPFGGSGSMTVSVPASALEATVAELAKLGVVTASSSETTDVTSQVVDTASRIETMRASVARVRALMAQARDVGQIVAIESELNMRQADLESLEAQLKALQGRVAQATVSVFLATPGFVDATQTGSFSGGLRSGWDAFVASGRALLTAVGAALPFAIFIALIGVPLLAWRRRRPVRPAPTASAAPPVTG